MIIFHVNILYGNVLCQMVIFHDNISGQHVLRQCAVAIVHGNIPCYYYKVPKCTFWLCFMILFSLTVSLYLSLFHGNASWRCSIKLFQGSSLWPHMIVTLPGRILYFKVLMIVCIWLLYVSMVLFTGNMLRGTIRCIWGTVMQSEALTWCLVL